MYHHILIPLENSPSDQVILAHIKVLARIGHARLVLLHVADGWAARNFEQLKLAESEEIQQDRSYLEAMAEQLRGEGFEVESALAMGEPSAEIVKFARTQPFDLIAMATHGHRLIGDILHGSTADKVRHEVSMPVLFLKAPK